MPGKAITVVDLTNPDQPKVVQRIDGPERPQSVAFNADGSLVAIACYPQNPYQKPLVLFAPGRWIVTTNLEQSSHPAE